MKEALLIFHTTRTSLGNRQNNFHDGHKIDTDTEMGTETDMDTNISTEMDMETEMDVETDVDMEMEKETELAIHGH